MWLFFFLVVVVLYGGWRFSRRRFESLGNKIPGPPGLPFIGNALDFVGSPHETFRYVFERAMTYPKIVKIWAGPILVVGIDDPGYIETILSSQVHIDKSDEYQFFKPWLGNGLLISTGDKWRAHRKLIAPTFHLNVLKSFIDLFNANSRQTVEKLRKELGKEFDCHDYMSEATVEILLETVMGVSKKTQDKSGLEYAKAVMQMCNIIHLRVIQVWLRFDLILYFTKYWDLQNKLLDTIHGLTRKVIKKKRADFAKGIRGSTAEVPGELRTKEDFTKVDVEDSLSFGLKDDLDDDDVGQKKRMAFLDLLLEASQDGIVINDEEIKEQVDTIMFEGHDTTAAASSFFLCLMGLHQKIQEKVFEELYEIFGDSDRPISFNDTLQMKYLERCLLETLRLFPPVLIFSRKLKEDVVLGSGEYTLPKGSIVLIPPIKVHRLEENYPNPDQFNPDNFLPENMANRHYYTFIPFSAGPRSCVGRKYAMLKLKILLATILRNYRIISDIPEKDYQLQGDIILKRADGFKIKLETRNYKK